MSLQTKCNAVQTVTSKIRVPHDKMMEGLGILMGAF